MEGLIEKNQKIKTDFSNSFPEEVFNKIEYIDDFKCSICLNIPNPLNAIEEINCGKLFCHDCINEWIKKQNICPSCRASLNIRDIKTQNKLIYRTLCKLKILCPFKCNWEGDLSEFLEKHINNCEFKLYECKYQKYGCTYKDNKSKIGIHEEDTKIHFNLLLDFAEKNNNPKMITFKLGQEYKVKTHIHPLVAVINSDTEYEIWGCDGRKLPGGCASNLYDFSVDNTGMERFHCAECKYDLCHNCVQKHLE